MSGPSGGLADQVLAAFFQRLGITKGSGMYEVVEAAVRPMYDALEARVMVQDVTRAALLTEADELGQPVPWPPDTVPLNPQRWHTSLTHGAPVTIREYS